MNSNSETEFLSLIRNKDGVSRHPYESISEGGPLVTTKKRLFNVKELAEYLGISKGSLYTMVCLEKIPKKAVVRIGRSLRFEKSEIDQWINGMKVS